MLNSRNIAPTAPHTLKTYPFSADDDPFILKTSPNIMVSGNSRNFEQRLVKSNDHQFKLISVPKFSSSGSIVFMDLDSLEAFEFTLC